MNSNVRKSIVGLAILFFLIIGLNGVSAQVPDEFVCLPTCAADDARFLSLAGTALNTLGEPRTEVEFVAPSTATELRIDVFDGETGGHWDLPGGTGDSLVFILYADPTGDGSGTTEVGRWDGATMADNDWTTLTVPTSLAAKAPNGDYFYALSISHQDLTDLEESNFKLRTTGAVMLLRGVSFGFVGGMRNVPLDAPIVYPGYPNNWDVANTTYDGRWEFFFNVPTDVNHLSIWDGDFDYGSYWDCAIRDTDDPNTPNGTLQPWMTGPGVVPEGVAVGSACQDGTIGTGAPWDDSRYPAYRRSPSVIYQVTAPNGNVYDNPNPSGNREWEEFRIETNPALDADYYETDLIEAGIYQVDLDGVDLANYNAWHFDYQILCVDELGDPCTPPPGPYFIGDYVWYDMNGNGLQDELPDAGIPGVVVNLFDTAGNLLDTTTTDADGYYFFDVVPGTYTVIVDPSNFDPGGALEGYDPTTGNQATRVVDDQSVLTYDFGYVDPDQGTAALGDFVWYDLNADGIQDPFEPGIPNVTLELLDAGGNVIATTVTDAVGGYYGFDGLDAGGYSVRVDTSTLPAQLGLVPTYDYDGILSADIASLSLAEGETNLDIDFGYALGFCPAEGQIGDTVWKDLDGDGIQDPGEPGIDGVTVTLYDSDGNVVATQVTGPSGQYLFGGLPAGTYTVMVDATTLPPGVEPTYDLDGLVTPHEATVTLVVGESNLDVDFGYKSSVVTVDCYTFRFASATTYSDGTTMISIEVQSDCDHGLSFIAFSMPDGIIALSPADGSTYSSPAGHSYYVENPTNNPFYGIKFEEQGADGIKDGEMDTFNYTLPAGAYDPSGPISITVALKDGTNYNEIILYPQQ